MKVLKISAVCVLLVLAVIILGRISTTLAYGLNHPGEYDSCVYPQRSVEQIDPIHAGETGILKKHVCK